MKRPYASVLMALSLVGFGAGCSREAALTPASNASERQRVNGLGDKGWGAAAEFELLRSGERHFDWVVLNQAQVVPLIIDLDEKGQIQVNEATHSQDSLKAWFANTVANFGAEDPLILRTKPQTPLPALEGVAGIAAGAGFTNVFVLANESTQSAHSVKLNGRFVPLTTRLVWSEGGVSSSE
ncbi:MAG TPA: hypothetical protein VFG14_06450 [Chthoniobacteraceae bacterium]|nr:hypothetical protein [Chthoniobacteraceae bacterium]